MTRDTRGSASSRGYDRKWRRVRAAKLRADPLCAECISKGRVTAADTVDHIIPIEQRPDLRLAWDNLRSMCRDCHEIHHGRKKERPEIGVDGYPVRG